MTILVDTSAVIAAKDESHPAHADVADLLLGTDDDLIVSPFVVAECDYMLSTRLHPAAAREFLGEVAKGIYSLADVDAVDVTAALGVIDRYSDLDVGIADAATVALAARYRTTDIATFDERHFRAMAPLSSADAFTLLPRDRT